MDDREIISLYHSRDETAIEETMHKYGAYCGSIALNILSEKQDAEECVNDTYFAAWRRMPPDRPGCLRVFLGKITRNLAISRYRAAHAKKRYAGIELILSELEECIPSLSDGRRTAERAELAEIIGNWLEGLDAADRALFVRRYWHGESVGELAERYGCTSAQMSQKMLRLRRQLKKCLEKEDITV